MATIEFPNGVVRDVQIYECSQGDWQALYLDGVLHSQGHDVTTTLLHLLGIEIRHDDAFLRGGNGGCSNNTAPTLGEIEQWDAERTADLEQARLLRAEGEGKLADAAAIEMRYRR